MIGKILKSTVRKFDKRYVVVKENVHTYWVRIITSDGTLGSKFIINRLTDRGIFEWTGEYYTGSDLKIK